MKTLLELEPENGPYTFEGQGPAVLLVHGYTATAYETRHLAKRLNRSFGFHTQGILLKGHGTTLADLDHAKATDWLDQTLTSLHKMVAKHGPVHFVGFSMGAGLGLQLQQQHPHLFRSLGLIVPTLWAKKLSSRLLLTALELTPVALPFKSIPKRTPPLVENISFRHYTLNSLKEAQKIFKGAQKTKPIAKIPCAIAQAEKDQTAHPKSAQFLAKKMKHPQSTHITIPNAPHPISLSPQKEILFEAVEKFYKSLG